MNIVPSLSSSRRLELKAYPGELGRTGIELFSKGRLDYLPTQTRMQELAALPLSDRHNQIWLLEHPPIYTQGTSCEQITLLPSEIPVVKSDRGGQITYHGPGQIVMYPLLNLRDLGLGVKALVETLEQAVIDLLADFSIEAVRRENAPGVYVNDAKIAALGLRVKNGMSYHGLSFNVDMDLQPFRNIDPCGFKGLRVTQLRDCLSATQWHDLQVEALGESLATRFTDLITPRNAV